MWSHCNYLLKKKSIFSSVINLALMPLSSVLQLFADEFQVTCHVEQVFSVWMKFLKDAFFTDPQFQICRGKKSNCKQDKRTFMMSATVIKRKQQRTEKHEGWTFINKPFRIIMTIHFISCAFVFLIRLEKTETFSVLFWKANIYISFMILKACEKTMIHMNVVWSTTNC